MSYSEDTVAQIRELWADPIQTARTIGDRFSLTEETVKKIAKRRRIQEGEELWPFKASHRPYPPEVLAEVKRQWQQRGVTTTIIAAATGLTRHMVIGIIDRGRKQEGIADWPMKWAGENRDGYVRKHPQRVKGAPRKPYNDGKPRAAVPYRPKPRPASPRPVAQPLPTEGLVRFLDSRRGQCGFPYWDDTRNWKPDRVETVMVCGRPTGDVTATYCECHRRLCFDARRTAASSRPFRHKALELV